MPKHSTGGRLLLQILMLPARIMLLLRLLALLRVGHVPAPLTVRAPILTSEAPTVVYAVEGSTFDEKGNEAEFERLRLSLRRVHAHECERREKISCQRV